MVAAAAAAPDLLVVTAAADLLAEEVRGVLEATPAAAAAFLGLEATVHLQLCRFHLAPQVGAAAVAPAGPAECKHTAAIQVQVPHTDHGVAVTPGGIILDTLEVMRQTGSGLHGTMHTTAITAWGGMVQLRCTVSRFRSGCRAMV